MRQFIRKIEKKLLQPFEFFSNFTYYAGQPNFTLRAAWQMAGEVVK